MLPTVTRPYGFEGRRCLLNDALFDVEDSRKPEPESGRRFYGGPEEGYLRDVEWAAMTKWGKIKFDQPVRKTSRATEVTYGVVSGIYADWKSEKFPGEAMKEYYVLRDEILDAQSDISKMFA
jgi:hypothetical protein